MTKKNFNESYQPIDTDSGARFASLNVFLAEKRHRIGRPSSIVMGMSSQQWSVVQISMSFLHKSATDCDAVTLSLSYQTKKRISVKFVRIQHIFFKRKLPSHRSLLCRFQCIWYWNRRSIVTAVTLTVKTKKKRISVKFVRIQNFFF